MTAKKIIYLIMGIIGGLSILFFFIFNFLISPFKIFNLISIIVSVISALTIIFTYKFKK